MRIPASVPLVGHRITISVIPKADWPHGDDCLGLWEPQQHLISIRADLDQTLQEQTFLHELTHAALDVMSHKLSRNEAFVDQFSSLLHQALSGARYAKRKRTDVKAI